MGSSKRNCMRRFQRLCTQLCKVLQRQSTLLSYMCSEKRTEDRALTMRRVIILLAVVAFAIGSYPFYEDYHDRHGFLKHWISRERWAPWGREVSGEDCTHL